VHQDQEETKLRLLNAAGEIFSQKGFRSGTIREICALAQANVASVNYHFGGKKELYEALLEYCHRDGLRRYPSNAGLKDDPQAEKALGAFIRSFLNRTLGHDSPAWSTRLMAREMADPSPGLARMVASSIRPNLERLMTIVTTLLGDGASDKDIRHCALSVVGQCQHYYRARGAIALMFPDVAWDNAGIEFLTRHILKFSLAAIRGYRQEGNNESR
jgi:TetR/AcrR family transcriptional regulator, regulator of cefoperazone and chloramphenicol sensitivity